ncbi:hypothetical protein JCM10207_006180 [Rhodosporidiobolus poonsookiae]
MSRHGSAWLYIDDENLLLLRDTYKLDFIEIGRRLGGRTASATSGRYSALKRKEQTRKYLAQVHELKATGQWGSQPAPAPQPAIAWTDELDKKLIRQVVVVRHFRKYTDWPRIVAQVGATGLTTSDAAERYTALRLIPSMVTFETELQQKLVKDDKEPDGKENSPVVAGSSNVNRPADPAAPTTAFAAQDGSANSFTASALAEPPMFPKVIAAASAKRAALNNVNRLTLPAAAPSKRAAPLDTLSTQSAAKRPLLDGPRRAPSRSPSPSRSASRSPSPLPHPETFLARARSQTKTPGPPAYKPSLIEPSSAPSSSTVLPVFTFPSSVTAASSNGTAATSPATPFASTSAAAIAAKQDRAIRRLLTVDPVAGVGSGNDPWHEALVACGDRMVERSRNSLAEMQRAAAELDSSSPSSAGQQRGAVEGDVAPGPASKDKGKGKAVDFAPSSDGTSSPSLSSRSSTFDQPVYAQRPFPSVLGALPASAVASSSAAHSARSVSRPKLRSLGIQTDAPPAPGSTVEEKKARKDKRFVERVDLKRKRDELDKQIDLLQSAILVAKRLKIELLESEHRVHQEEDREMQEEREEQRRMAAR